LIELVMVIVIIGALAVFALPKALDLTAWRLTAFADELRAQANAVQRMALVQRRPVVATLSTTGASFDYVAGGNIATVNCPATVTPCLSAGSGATVTYNASNTGSVVTSTGGAVAVTIGSGSTSLSYQIETETGLFRALP
jgi:type II secretory pathway pseudopilin PulG